jgi:TrmH family RNA methyltransferase
MFAEVGLADLPLPENLSRVLILDRVADPGNLGTLLRTALALGWDAALWIEGSADPHNPKAVRASRGAHFKLPIQKTSWKDVSELLKKHSMVAYGADVEGISPESIKTSTNILLVLGNEGQGLSKEARSLCHLVSIAMKHDVESLNVAQAGAILMYVLKDLP